MSFLNKLFNHTKEHKCSVFVYAYMELNVGDDLFVHKLISLYPDVHFIIFAKKPYKEMFLCYNNVTIWEEDSLLFNILKKMEIADRIRWRVAHGCDYAVYIAGSIFMEYSEWNKQHLWYKELFDNDKLYFLGCNWGPCETKQFKEDMTDVLSKMKDICFRDKYSYRTFEQLPNVRYAPDILLGIDWLRYAGIDEKKQVFISVIDCRRKEDSLKEKASEYEEYIKCWIEYFSSLGYQIKLCSFCEKEGDLVAAEQILNVLEANARKCTTIVNYCGTNIDEILRLIAESEYVLATRFHAMILGLVARKKVLPIVYSNKMRNVLSDLSFQGLCADIMQFPLKDTMRANEITYGITDNAREQLSKDSEKHFKVLNEVLM